MSFGTFCGAPTDADCIVALDDTGPGRASPFMHFAKAQGIYNTIMRDGPVDPRSTYGDNMSYWMWRWMEMENVLEGPIKDVTEDIFRDLGYNDNGAAAEDDDIDAESSNDVDVGRKTSAEKAADIMGAADEQSSQSSVSSTDDSESLFRATHKRQTQLW